MRFGSQDDWTDQEPDGRLREIRRAHLADVADGCAMFADDRYDQTMAASLRELGELRVEQADAALQQRRM